MLARVYTRLSCYFLLNFLFKTVRCVSTRSLIKMLWGDRQIKHTRYIVQLNWIILQVQTFIRLHLTCVDGERSLEDVSIAQSSVFQQNKNAG